LFEYNILSPIEENGFMAELMLVLFVTFRLMVYNTRHYCY